MCILKPDHCITIERNCEAVDTGNWWSEASKPDSYSLTLSNFTHFDDTCTDVICSQTNGQLDAFP
jgi:hypothetical protein